MNHKTIRECKDETFASVRQLIEAFETLDSATSAELRRQVVQRGREWGLGQTPNDADCALEAPMRKYADKCARYAYRVYDAEVDELKKAGHSEPEIVDITLAASFGVSLARLERGLMLLEEEEG